LGYYLKENKLIQIKSEQGRVIAYEVN